MAHEDESNRPKAKAEIALLTKVAHYRPKAKAGPVLCALTRNPIGHPTDNRYTRHNCSILLTHKPHGFVCCL